MIEDERPAANRARAGDMSDEVIPLDRPMPLPEPSPDVSALQAAMPGMHPLERFNARHPHHNQVPSPDLLLLSIAQDTHEMLLMARENQEYIRNTIDMQRA